jgi:hypothetical protein
MATYDLSEAEAVRRLALEDQVDTLLDDFAGAFGDGYGGLWLDHEAGGVVYVGVRPGQADTVRTLAAGRGVAPTVVPVERTLAELGELQQELLKQVPADSGVGVGGLYTPTNQVNLTVERPDAATLASEIADEYGGAVRVRAVEGELSKLACGGFAEPNVWCDPPLRGGMGITAGRTVCTAGFNVRSVIDGKYYVLTAGHCHSNEMYQTRFANREVHNIGLRHRWFDNQTADAMTVNVNNPSGWRPAPWVVVTGNGSTVRNDSYVIRRHGTTAIGTTKCATGRRDGTQCGTVTDNSRPGVAPGRPSVAEVRGGCLRAGDSGGPVYRNGTAFGIVHGGAVPGGDPNQCSIRWYYQGVREALALLNVRLIVAPGP